MCSFVCFKTIIHFFLKMTFRYNLSYLFLNRYSRNITESLTTIRSHSFCSPFRILFLGSDDIALSSLTKINNLRKATNIIKTLDLVTANNSNHNSIIEKYALSHNIKVIQWPLQRLQHGEYDIGLIVSFGNMIKKDILEKFPMGMVNVHPSLLPRWRGAAPIIHTLLNGDNETGVTLMKIKADKFDVGEIISQTKYPVSKDILLPELTEQLSLCGADMLAECIKTLPDSLNNLQPQSSHGITYATKINKTISEVRWSDLGAEEVYNLYRAVYGLYSLTTHYKNKQIKLFDAFLDNVEPTNYDKPIGAIEYCSINSAIKVYCKDKRYIYFRSLRIVGKRKITATDFYNGYIKNNQSDCKNNIFY